jgi:hypothetical protein
MKTNYITHEHFNKIVNVIVKEFPSTKVSKDTATDYRAWNFDFIVRASVSFVIHSDGETDLIIGIPGNTRYVWAHTHKEFRRARKQLIAACRKYR